MNFSYPQADGHGLLRNGSGRNLQEGELLLRGLTASRGHPSANCEPCGVMSQILQFGAFSSLCGTLPPPRAEVNMFGKASTRRQIVRTRYCSLRVKQRYSKYRLQAVVVVLPHFSSLVQKHPWGGGAWSRNRYGTLAAAEETIEKA